MSSSLLRRALRRAAVGFALVATALLVAPAAMAQAVPHPQARPGAGGIYANTAHYTPGANTTRGWKVSWKAPLHTNNAFMVVGQWYFGFESGLYYTPGEGWWVYYYGDDDGLTGNNPDCFESWGSGGHCTGAMTGLEAGDEVTFTYKWCDASFTPSLTGTYNCVWVDLKDGAGDRFLAGELRTNQTVEIYTHEVETFGDSNYTEPIIPCNQQPVRMLGQQVLSSTGTWTTLTGNVWRFDDNNPNYKFQNVNTSTTPATWESCSEVPNCPAAWVNNQLYPTDTLVGHNGHKWKAKWWTYGNEPGVTNAWDDLGVC